MEDLLYLSSAKERSSRGSQWLQTCGTYVIYHEDLLRGWFYGNWDPCWPKSWWWTTRGIGGCLSQLSSRERQQLDSYKYLEVQINKKRDLSHNTDPLFTQGQSRLLLLRRLRCFSVFNRLLQTFNQSIVAWALFFAVVCWGGLIKADEARRLNNLVRKGDEGQNQSYSGKPLSPPLRQAVANGQLIWATDHP